MSSAAARAKAIGGMSHVFSMAAGAITEMLFTGVFERFPELQMCWIETGVGWLPHFLESIDDRYWRNRSWGDSQINEPPSFYWHRNNAASFITDRTGIALRHAVGVDNMMWSSDYPHHGNDWPYSRKVIDDTMGAHRGRRAGEDHRRQRGAHLAPRRLSVGRPLSTGRPALDRAERQALQRAVVHVVDEAAPEGQDRRRVHGGRVLERLQRIGIPVAEASGEQLDDPAFGRLDALRVDAGELDDRRPRDADAMQLGQRLEQLQVLAVVGLAAELLGLPQQAGDSHLLGELRIDAGLARRARRASRHPPRRPRRCPRRRRHARRRATRGSRRGRSGAPGAP